MSGVVTSGTAGTGNALAARLIGCAAGAVSGVEIPDVRRHPSDFCSRSVGERSVVPGEEAGRWCAEMIENGKAVVVPAGVFVAAIAAFSGHPRIGFTILLCTIGLASVIQPDSDKASAAARKVLSEAQRTTENAIKAHRTAEQAVISVDARLHEVEAERDALQAECELFKGEQAKVGSLLERHQKAISNLQQQLQNAEQQIKQLREALIKATNALKETQTMRGIG